ncbi:MAG TPA: hypothetical protein VH375_05705 [Rhodanobacteraceae bacterium]|jgi:hypothetical protein
MLGAVIEELLERDETIVVVSVEGFDMTSFSRLREKVPAGG